jgi:hypothetical protein
MNHEKQAVIKTVTNYLDNYARKNLENCMSVIVASTPILLFGTNDNEVFRSTEEIRAAFTRDFSNIDDIRWGAHRYLHVEASPTLASVVLELSIGYTIVEKEVANDVETLFRYAFTLVKEDKQWKICAGLASVPFATGTYNFGK